MNEPGSSSQGPELASKKCVPCEGGIKPKTEAEVRELLKEIPGWEYGEGAIVRKFIFKDYPETVRFVNAVASITERENHHPKVEFGYKSCSVRYSTHAVGGLSDNDFICAAKINLLSK